VPKFGAESSTACGSGVVKNYFSRGLGAKHDRAYQVTRSEFDELLLDHAAENGAEVREQTCVEQLEFGPEEVGLTVKSAGTTQKVRAKYVLDCSGRDAFIGSYFKLT